MRGRAAAGLGAAAVSILGEMCGRRPDTDEASCGRLRRASREEARGQARWMSAQEARLFWASKAW
jgi:hypothetical protein